MRLIAFCGPRGSGKDTCASMTTYKTVAFAEALKELCMNAFNLTYDQVHDPILKERDFETPIIFDEALANKLNIEIDNCLTTETKPAFTTTTVLTNPRAVMQFVGTDYIRNGIDTMWNIKAFAKKLQLLQSKDPNTPLVVTDLRFVNEYLFLIKEYNADVFYIHRDAAEELLTMTKHESEKQVLEVRKLICKDNIIYNNGTLGDLKKELKLKLKLE